MIRGSGVQFLPTVDYVHLHVTLLSTTSPNPLPERFGLKPGSWISRSVFTTAAGIRTGGPAPDFQSISYHQTFGYNGRKEYVFKIFSLDHKSDEWLEGVFGVGTVGWVHRKEVSVSH